MRSRLVLVTFIFYGAMILAGCTMVSTPAPAAAPNAAPAVLQPSHPHILDLTPVVAPTGSFTISINNLPGFVLSDACQQYTVFNGEEAYKHFPGATLWMFHTNFRPGDTADDFWGCLRFYYRITETPDMSGTFTGTLASAVLVPCHKHEQYPNSVQFITYTVPEITNSDGEPVPETLNRKVRLEEKGYVTCDLNISQGAYEIWHSTNLTDELALLPSETDRITAMMGLTETAQDPNALYDYFSMGAVISRTSTIWATNPVIKYVPKLPEVAPNPAYTVSFNVPGGPPPTGQLLSFTTSIQAIDYSPNPDRVPSGTTNPCQFSSADTGAYAWMNFGKYVKDPDGYLRFFSQPAQAQQRGLECGPSEILPFPKDDRMPFWAGDATLYIGYDPDTDSSTNSDVYEVWLDPDSMPRSDAGG